VPVETPLLILGARIFGEEIADLASEIPGLRVAGFVENLDRDHPKTLHGLPVHWIDDIAPLAATHRVVCALTTTRRRGFVEAAARLGFSFATLVHPTARLAPSSTIGEGTILSAGCFVAAHTRIGRHVILNRGTLVGHHTEIGDFVTVQPGGNIAGLCRIGDAAYLGMGAIVIDRLAVGEGAIVGAGALVTKSVPAQAMVAGSPARVVKSDVEPK
jgi:sugar O-acyltransferase (sialic acid O-acetyltransferase NeuD family)